jgi:hypothetical protein
MGDVADVYGGIYIATAVLILSAVGWLVWKKYSASRT